MTNFDAARLAVDIGGTFTDVVLEAGDARESVKVLTTPRAPEAGVLEGVRAVLARTGLEPAAIGTLIHGTTLATNALIERKGARTALVTTAGFRDVLAIADEGRYDQYDVFIAKPAPLVPRWLRFPVPERVDAAGTTRLALDEDAVRALAPELREHGVEAIAVGFMHAYANPDHEVRTRELLEAALPDVPVSISAEVCPELREYERFSTTCANAYVQPLMARYLERLAAELRALGIGCPPLLVTSGGGLTSLETAMRFPIRLVESGPAGGAILAAGMARDLGLGKVLSFDMGGTTAKICLIEDGRPDTARSFEVARAARFLKRSGLPLRIPVIEMVEIGAGGGSIARVDALRQIAVGPDSAGSEPGPACYGRGGDDPTVTDADVALGRIGARGFAGGAFDLHPERAAAALDAAVGGPLGLSTEISALGVAEMIDETMANAARVHAVERGKVVSDHTLIAFGGAAPVHAARLAEKLGIDRVVVPADAGVGSAIGFLRAPIAYEVVRSRYVRLKDFDPAALNAMFDELAAEARGVVAQASTGPWEEQRLAYMRYAGQGHEIVVPLPARGLDLADRETIQRAYDALYVQQFARVIPGADIEILTWALTLSAPAPAGAPAPAVTAGAGDAGPAAARAVFDPAAAAWSEVAVHERAGLAAGRRVTGPCIIVEPGTSTHVPAGFEAHRDGHGNLVLERHAPSPR